MHMKRGSRVIALMRSGEHLVGKFKDNKGGFIYFSDREPLPTTEIRTLGYYKPLERTRKRITIKTPPNMNKEQKKQAKRLIARTLDERGLT